MKSRAMTRFVLLLITFVIPFSTANAQDSFFGSWLDASDASKIEILDGFASNVGAVLLTDENGDIQAGKWTFTSGEMSVKIGFSSNEAEILGDGSLSLNRRSFVRDVEAEDPSDVRILLRRDPKEFVEALTLSRWRTTLDTQQAIFQTTFSTNSGVVVLSNAEEINELSSWGVSSGILKIGRQTIADARISGRYFVGITDREDFIVFIQDGLLGQAERTSLEGERAAFFDRLLTDGWQTVQSFGLPTIHRFRQIDGELKGRVFAVSDRRLTSAREWEYSPATGALKIGYTDYVGALVVGDTLALLQGDGKQTFFIRPDNELAAGRRFTLSDVKRTPLSEQRLEDLVRVLSGNFSLESYAYLFEFGEDSRNGFIHEFRSIPFNLTGETFTNELFRRSGALFEVEEFVVFDGARAFMRDQSITRLAPMAEDASIAAAEITRQIIESEKTTGVSIRIIDKSGVTHNINLPIESFENIRTLEIIGR